MLGAIYGCQVVIYILHRRFEHIGEFVALAVLSERVAYLASNNQDG